MDKFRHVFLWVAVIVLWGTGCSLSAEEIASTVENEVARQVQATVESLPSATPVDTSTPRATFTPQATYTPYPTLTPIPTLTPWPTYTPFPTLEPTPEETATAVPTATSPPATQAAVEPLPTVSTSNLQPMKTALATMLAGLDNYKNTISAIKQEGWWNTTHLPVDCPANVAARNSVISTVTLDVSHDIPEVQNAYAVYLDVAQRFAANTAPWNEGCLTAIANGEPKKVIDDVQKGVRIKEIEEFQNILNNVNNALLTMAEG
mgnify:CR=1 FL=1